MAAQSIPPNTRSSERAHELLRAWDPRAASFGQLGGFLGRLTTVDQVGVTQRVDALRRRSIKRESKLWALDLAIRMTDLTTLEGRDTPGKVRALCAKGMRPKPGDPSSVVRSVIRDRKSTRLNSS